MRDLATISQRIELRHLRYFLQVAETASFTRAAERLHVAQPTLSHQIRQLEETVGAALFERRPKSVRLTAAGALFRPYCERVLAELDAGTQALSDLGQLLRGTLRMAVAHSFSTTTLPSALSEFALRHPGVRVVTQLIAYKDMERDLLSGDLDLAVAYLSGESTVFDVERLGEEALVLAVNPDHPWAGRASVAMKDLAELPLVLLTEEFAARRFVDNFFAGRELQPHLVLEMNAVGPILDTVRNSRLATVLSSGALFNVPGIRTIQLVDPVPRRTCAIFWRRGAPRSPAALRMASLIKEAYRQPPSSPPS